MNPEIKTEWVAALRSGKYQQGTDVLTSVAKGTNCCLGVLCELAVAAGVPLYVEDVDGKRTYDGNDFYPPTAVIKWAGLDNLGPDKHNPRVEFESEHRPVAKLNDEGKTFAQIADAIEKSL